MGKPGQSSFRRILLSRILLLTIPVLLIGEYIVYRKARSGFLDTARQNLTESAVRKGEDVRGLTAALQSSLLVASEGFADQLGRSRNNRAPQANPAKMAQAYVQQLEDRLPPGVDCIQLTNRITGTVEGSTCGQEPIRVITPQTWPTQRPSVTRSPSIVSISPSAIAAPASPHEKSQQLNLVFSTPVYDPTGKLRYALTVRSSVQRREFGQRASLAGYTVIINQDGLILAHPNPQLAGQTIRQLPNAEVIQAIVGQAIADKQEALDVFQENGRDWLAGYSPVQIPFQNGQNQTWIILAAAPLDNAVYELRDIKLVLFILTLGLIGASLLATVYIARDLAAPLEALGQYALQISDRVPNRRPQTFKIRELNQLATVLSTMVHRLDERADELETAWQEAQSANQLKSEFLATTSHELRTPLNAIIGSVQLVKDGYCDSEEEEQQFLQQANDAAVHLLKIINDLLDISKIEAGKVELNLQPISIPELCKQCLHMIQPGAEKKQLSLGLQVEGAIAQVLLDERRVRQMLINLLSNAVKFTPEGGHVTLSACTGYGYQLEQENRPDRSPITPTTAYLCLEVADSGIGIPPERWHLLFRPFQQIDSSHTRKHEGTGLGLALTKRLAELHGGTLSFDSAANKGSSFRLWLPMRSDR